MPIVVTPKYAAEVQRACLPEVLLVEDVQRALGLATPGAARKAIASGRCGPWSRQGRRLIVRREAFLAALEAAEVTPHEGARPPAAKPRFVELLKGGR